MNISLFVTCMVDTFYPQVGVSMVRLLRRLGVNVDFPGGQTCCGQPAFNSGYADAARESAIQLLESFAGSEAVVTPSGSCAAMVRRYYPSLFSNTEWEDVAKDVASKTFELSEFIVEKLELTDLEAVYPARVTYHSSCHMMRGLDVRQPPIKLLNGVDRLELIDLPFANECCGFGGTFAVKIGDVSTAMADEKIDYATGTGADIIVGSDMACLMHLGGRLEKRGVSMKVMHLAELLDAATDRSEVEVAQERTDETGHGDELRNQYSEQTERTGA